eukprot:scaffold11809_cov128-Cylindrotheca_fusiformis.AAC.26
MPEVWIRQKAPQCADEEKLFRSRKSHTMNKRKRVLQRQIRDLVSAEEQCLQQCSDVVGRRSFSIGILEAVGSFLVSWSELEDTSGMPDAFIRKVLLNVIQVLGVGAPQLRDSLWNTFQSSWHAPECCEMVLQFLPATILPQTDKEDKERFLQLLKQVFDEDSRLVSPILDCLSTMCKSGGLEKRHVFQFAYDKLPKEHESRIHLVIKTLVEHISNDRNAKAAVEAVRTEMRSIEDTGSPARYIVPTCKLLIEAWNQGEDELFFNIYMTVLGGLGNNGMEDRLGVVDVVVLLLSTRKVKIRHTTQIVMEWILSGSHLKSETISLFLCDEVWGSIGEELAEDLISISCILLTAPIRNPENIDIAAAWSFIKHFMNCVFVAIGDSNESSRRLVTSMLLLTDELVLGVNTATKTIVGAATENSGVGEAEVFHGASSEIFDILSTNANQIPRTLARFKDRLFHQLLTTRSSRLHTDFTLRRLCALICNLEAATNDDGYSFETLPSVTALQRLLFSPPSVFPSDRRHSIDRIRHGFLLAREILSHSRLQGTPSVYYTWRMLKSVLLPQNKKMIEPSIGLEGLEVARILSSNSSDTSLKHDVFQTTTHILSNTRLIHYVSEYNERQRKHVAQAYTKRDEFFKSENENHKKRKMIFCFDAFLRDPTLVEPSEWRKVNQWIFNLVDTYLAIGRQTELYRGQRRWSPRPWVEAAIEYHIFDGRAQTLRNARQKRFFDLLHKEIGCSDVSSPRISPNVREREIYDLSRVLANDRDLEQIMRSMFRLALTLIISLAMTAAILNNAHEQCKDALHGREGNEATGTEKWASSLIHFQLAKLYDIRRKCNILDKVLRSMGLLKRKRAKRAGRRTTNEKRVLDEESVQKTSAVLSSLAELRAILSAYFSKSDFVRSEILWDVAVDSVHDSTLVELINRIVSSSTKSDDEEGVPLRSIIALKSKVLKHLSSQTSFLAERSALGLAGDETEYLASLRPKLARCLRLCSHLSLQLPNLRGAIEESDSNESADSIRISVVESLSVLAAAYFRLSSNVMILVLEAQVKSRDQTMMTLPNFLNLYSAILGAKEPLGEGVDFEKEMGSTNLISFQVLEAAVQSHLKICCDASIASELLETLSIFSIRLGGLAVSAMVEVSWNGLHTDYPDHEAQVVLSSPYSFRRATLSLLSLLNGTPSDSIKAEQVVQKAIARMSVAKSKSGKSSFLIHGMLRHWGLLALSPTCFSSFDDHLRRLLSNVKDFLSDVAKPATSTDCRSRRGESSDEDGDYLPPQFRREVKPTLLKTSKVCGLNASSFSAYFDTLMQMTIAATSIFFLTQEADPNDTSHPFQRLTSFIEIFGSLVMLCAEKLYVFPSKTLPAILGSSKHMLDVTSYQMQRCIEWRNSQPVILFHEIHAGKDDAASTQHLEDLVDSIGTHIVRRVDYLCTALRSVTGESRHVEHQSRLKSLVTRNDQLKAELVKIATAHSISQPSFDLGLQASEANRSRKRQRIEGISQKGQISSAQFSHQHGRDLKNPTETQPAPLTVEGQSYSSEASFGDYDSSSNFSDSFGASGEWGNASDDDSVSQPGATLTSTWVRPM